MLFAPFTGLTFAVMVQKQWRVKLLVPYHSLIKAGTPICISIQCIVNHRSIEVKTLILLNLDPYIHSKKKCSVLKWKVYIKKYDGSLKKIKKHCATEL